VKPKTPYQHLLEAVRVYRSQVEHPRRREMWTYSKADLNSAWSLDKLAERVMAAGQLGYRVEIVNTSDGGLRVEYVKKHDDIGWSLWT